MKTLLRGIQLNGTELLLSYFTLILPRLDVFPDKNVNTRLKLNHTFKIMFFKCLPLS